jgi:TetR/AcrR family transcriptional repressor of mexJK operon
MDKDCPHKPRSSAKREAILDAAQALFLRQGYAGTSMDQVAATAGVSKATIYAHFTGKDELFGAIIRRRCQSSFDLCTLPGLGAMDARTALTAIATQLMDLLLSPEALGVYRIVVAEAMRHPDLVLAYHEAGPARGKAYMQAVMDALVARGELACDDTWRATDFFIGMLRTEYFHRALMGMPQTEGRTLKATIDDAVAVMLRAYAPAGA